MTKIQKILITGSGGMVGSQIGFGIPTTRPECDILNPDSIERAIEKYCPTHILHLAAMTDMGLCEKMPQQAFDVNVLGTYFVARACKKHKISLIYLSTCAVFDGKKPKPYLEKDMASPLNVYGLTKLLGEYAVLSLVPKALIIRTGWLFGGASADKKFVARFFYDLKSGKDIRATKDRFGSPTFIPDLIDTISKMIIRKDSGIVHVVNRGMASYAEVGEEIKKIGKFKSSVIPISARDVESSDLARGRVEALVSSKIKMRHWKQALREYVDYLMLSR